mgnify:FL=1
MEDFERKKHWETIYQTKELNEVSWYQPNPETSLQFFQQLEIPVTAKIIDIGGGDSFLTDHLLDLGYQDLSVLDVSETAIERAKQRLGERAKDVKWIVSDVSDFQPTTSYDCWHDRAAFHFLTKDVEVEKYVQMASKAITTGGKMIIGTFSEQGPKKCSGIDIRQYSETTMTDLFSRYFQKITCITADHKTPFDTTKNFVFCSFRKQ